MVFPKIVDLPTIDNSSLQDISIGQFSYGDDNIAHPTKYQIRLNWLIDGYIKRVYHLDFEITTIPGFLANDIELVNLGGCPYKLTRMDFRKIRKIINNHINSHYS